MPSGLTCKIYNGEELSLRDFALRCATQLGAGYRASHQGEIDLPKDKAPILMASDYHKKQIHKAENEITKWENLKENLKQAQKLYDEQYAENMRYNAESKEKQDQLRERYITVLKKVEAWNVPDRYASLKELMIKQLNDSLKWDCTPYTPYKEERVPVEEWIDTNLRIAKRCLEYHIYEQEQAQKSIEVDNSYLKGLYDALDEVEPLT